MTATKVGNIVNGLLSGSAEQMGTEDVILQLAHDKEVYRTALYSAAERILEQEKAFAELQAKFEALQLGSVSLPALAKQIEQQFHNGNVPIPSMFGRHSHHVVDITCPVKSISIPNDGESVVKVKVFFSRSGDMSDEEIFYLMLVPGPSARQHSYSGFHMGYTKVEPAKKRVRKVNVKAATATPSTDAVTTVKVVNTTPPTDTLS